MATLRETFKDIADAIREKGVSGTFKPIEMASKIGEIQTGEDYGYLTFTATTSSGATLNLTQNGGIAPHKLLKSTDGVNWTKWDNPSTNGISIGYGESVYIKADEDASWRMATSTSVYNKFTSTKGVECRGDIRSLVKMIAPADYSSLVANLFSGCTSLTQAPELPATTLPSNCYTSMFQDCTSLTTAPTILPATTLASYCYYYMFKGCTSLTEAPELPAITLANNCYYGMFQGCTSLVKAPELPATTLGDQCYSSMFQDCTSLESAPYILPATTLATNCYANMFRNCTSLVNAPELPATTLATNCYNSMFYGCTSLTTAPTILPATTLATNCYANMFRNCTSLVNAPELPATNIGSRTVSTPYGSMFYGCTSLKRIKMNASSGNWGTDMFNGCTSLELVDMTGSTGVPQLSNVNNFNNTNSTYKIVVPDSLYDTWIAATNWSSASIKPHIMKQSDWNSTHPDDILP